MLDIQTFDARQGGNVLYKALAHPVAAERIASLASGIDTPLAIYDPDGICEALLALHPSMPRPIARYVHDVAELDRKRAGLAGSPLTALPETAARLVLIAAFDTARLEPRIASMLPAGARLATLDTTRLPDVMLTNRRRYLDRLNFATNHAFFRDQNGLSTRLVTANYWSGYGAGEVRLWLRLYDEGGVVIAEWEEPVAPGAAGIVIDSRDIRARFNLPAFTGQLFIHAIGAAGHDVIKYALDTYGDDTNPSLSCTHDANAWPSERYAGLPAPREDERVTLWVQNSHAAPIPANTIALDQMGAEQPAMLAAAIAPFATVALDVASLLPDLRWPSQIELRAGRHTVRPRYEILREGRTRIAHVNVERADLKPDPGIATLSNLLGRGYLLPFPIMPRAEWRTIVQPNPMAHGQSTLPLRLDVFDREGRPVGERFLGCLPRRFDLALDLAEFEVDAGHAELVYDFRDGGEADGWMHALVRYEHHASGHVAETSFGSHIFNTAMTYRDEPQSYSGPPPGLSTRLFLKLGDGERRSFTALIYPASADWHPVSSTKLVLHDREGGAMEERPLAIACRGSALVFPDEVFGADAVARAGVGGYVMIRDTTCRLFGYHGLVDDRGGFSLDHMFGF